MKELWAEYYHDIFDGFDDNSGNFIPGMMIDYDKWTCADPENKFKTMYSFGIVHHANIYRRKVGREEDATQLETN